jgi:cytochrome P450/NADPH-cytochrome P450 reductase
MALARQYGPIFAMPGFDHRFLVISDPALVDEICSDQYFDKMIGTTFQQIRVFLGDGLFSAYTEEPNWHKAHNILLPNFSLQAMKRYIPEMLDAAGQLMLKWERLNPGDPIDVPADMTRMTVETIGLCGFSYRFNSFYHDAMPPFVQALLTALTVQQEATLSGKTPEQTAADPRMQQALSVMNTLVDEVIALRKSGGPEAIAAHHDMLSYMLTGVDKQSGERLDDATIRNEILTFMVAGHETTSGLLSFALSFLLTQPAVLARATAEADRVLGDDLGVAPTYEQVSHLTYTAQILKESLRLYPPVPGINRHTYQPRALGGKYPIGPEDELHLLTPQLHRDPAVWGADAEQFNPDHFNPEAEEKRSPNAWLPFGIGQRACIGRQFALQEATLVLGMLLQRFELVDHTNYQLQLRQAGTLKPVNFHIKVRLRPGRVISIPSPVQTSPSQAVSAGTAAASAAAAGAPRAGAHNTPLLILFGSNLGTCEDLAHQISNGGTAHGFASTVAPLDDYTGKLPGKGAVVVVTSSYNGTPPDNAARFCAWLKDGASQDGTSGDGAGAAGDGAKDAGTTPPLREVHYTVFGCGNHEWTATYQAIPRLVDAQLVAHGAQRIHPLGAGDAAGDLDGAFQAWYRPLWTALAQALAIDVPVDGPAAAATRVGTLYTVERVSAPANPVIASSGVQPMTLRATRELQSGAGGRPPERSTRHIEVALPAGVTYRTGDHLGVLPRNGVGLVQRVLDHFHLAGDAYVRISRNGSGTPALPLDQPVLLIDLLTHYVELQEVASRAQFAALADYTDCAPDKQRLLELADDAHYPQEILAKRLTLLDLLEQFPTCALPFHAYLELLHPLRIRYYSISSSPLADEHTCSITVAVVNAPARSGRGTYEGVCSTYLARHPEESVIDALVHRPHMAFEPPADATVPIIMIGPGTGFAPFRGFLQERAARQANGDHLGPALLFFGCRHPEQDYIYREELEAYAAQGVAHVYPAFSRVEGQPKRYVQDVIREHADEIWPLLQQGAVIYICGDGGKMEPDVRQALMALYQERVGAGAHAGEGWLADLRDEGRYLADVWANG